MTPPTCRRLIAALSAMFWMAIPVQATDLTPIPYERFVLANGLTVIVNEDHTAPLVTVVVVYKVGSKNEGAGQNGYAHLFEHLMFNGTENLPGEYFGPLRKVGASGVGGTTARDLTVFEQTVPRSGLETVFWMESDRMGYLLGALTEAKIEEQRKVVGNEIQMVLDEPLAAVEYRGLMGLYPPDHPYRRRPLGVMADLEAASLGDIRGWFEAYYGAANAVIVVTGDASADEIRTLAETYFAEIRSGPSVPRLREWVIDRRHVTLDEVEAAVPQAVVERWWAVPGRRQSDESARLWILEQLLGGNKTAILDRRLMQERRLASKIQVSYSVYELSGVFKISVSAADGVQAAELASAFDAAFEDVLGAEIDAADLSSAKTRIKARLAARRDDLQERAYELAIGEVYADDPDSETSRMTRVDGATAAEIETTARRWLADNYYQVIVRPRPALRSEPRSVDRSSLPKVPELSDPVFPAEESFTLDSGLKVVLVDRRDAPLIQLAVQFDAGAVSDGLATPGLAGFALDMLDEGSNGRSWVEVADVVADIGGAVETAITEESSTIKLSALRGELPDALALMADMVRNPAFLEDAIERVRRQRMSQLAAAKSELFTIAAYYVPLIVYGASHPYGRFFAGLGTEEGLARIGRDELAAYHRTRLVPGAATLVVLADMTTDDVRALIEESFGEWRSEPAETIEAPRAQDAMPSPGGRLILVDKPGAGQTAIIGARHLPPELIGDGSALIAVNDMVSGNFMSRINLNLREDKGWAYGNLSRISWTRTDAAWLLLSLVDAAKTVPALQEVQRELRDIAGDRPPTDAELSASVSSWGFTQLGGMKSGAGLLNALLEVRGLNRPSDYNRRLISRLKALRLAEVRTVAAAIVDPAKFDWIIWGDTQRYEEGLRNLGLGTIEVWQDFNRAVAP